MIGLRCLAFHTIIYEIKDHFSERWQVRWRCSGRCVLIAATSGFLSFTLRPFQKGHLSLLCGLQFAVKLTESIALLDQQRRVPVNARIELCHHGDVIAQSSLLHLSEREYAFFAEI